MSLVDTSPTGSSSSHHQMSPPNGAIPDHTLLRHQPAPPPAHHHASVNQHHMYASPAQQVPPISIQNVNFATTPFQIQLPSQAPRPPTLAECDIIMRHLQHVNDQQAHEVRSVSDDTILDRDLNYCNVN